MVALVAFYDALRWIVTILSLVFGVRKLYRWVRRKFKRNKRKSTAS